MKQLYINSKFLIFTFLITVFGCQTDEEFGAFKAEKEAISISQKEISIGKEGGEVNIEINANLPWRAESKDFWISLNTSQGVESGNLNYVVDANQSIASRTGTIDIWITQSSKISHVIKQEAGDLPPDISQNIYVKPEGNGDGSSWDQATNLGEALTMEVFDGDIIHLAAGTYVPSKTITGGDESDSKDLTFEITKNIKLIGGYPLNPVDGDVNDPSNNKTILSGAQANHVIVVSASKADDEEVELNGLIIRDGFSSVTGNITINGINYPRNYGAGLIIANARLKLESCEVSNNKAASGHGIGMYAFSNAEISINNSKIVSNIGSGSNNGAGLYFNGAEAIVTNTTIENNATNGVGAGIQTLGSSILHVYNSTIANNIAGVSGAAGKRAGGIYNRNNSHAVLVNCTIYGNSATGFGGAIHTHDNSTTDIISSTITANNGIGGGINNTIGCAVNVYNSIVSGNTGEGMASDIIGDITFKKSVEGNTFLDEEGLPIVGDSFDHTIMIEELQDNGGKSQTCRLLGDDNPAKTNGMSVTALQILGINFNPSVPDNISTKDQVGEDREGTTVIGALIK